MNQIQEREQTNHAYPATAFDRFAFQSDCEYGGILITTS